MEKLETPPSLCRQPHHSSLAIVDLEAMATRNWEAGQKKKKFLGTPKHVARFSE